MIEKAKLPANFKSDFEQDFRVFSSRFIVKIQYVGPIPSMSKPKEPEVFWFAIYQHDELVDSGVVEWDPENGVLMFEELAKAVLLFCAEDTE